MMPSCGDGREVSALRWRKYGLGLIATGLLAVSLGGAHLALSGDDADLSKTANQTQVVRLCSA
ncbi:hypothetical protein SAMN04489764_4304 [Thermostaphylospora chromogena]|uniref:Uncharacterized protein n=1 Tax=Thermostaphylospora chromogena TaxID=35622 RepID=A0A1H1HD49_9ACTN|nr:hypothetical protein SAMN04489764_4304 [Thermostaphylospora chromogena]